jgi:DNA polymerase III delta prime subunit
MMNKLWVEAYRPETLNGYVFKDSSQKEQIQAWIKEGTIPHLLLSGSAGIGKTTIAKILINQLDVQDTDVLIANGSKEGRKIEWVDKLITFCQTMPWGDYKIVLIDEADYMNIQSVQPALRNLMEEYSHSVRFILTCNYPNKIMPALHSRCQHMHFAKIDQTEFTARVAEILITEQVEFDLDTLDSYVKAYYPDLRKTINTVQQNTQANKLTRVKADSSTQDYKLEMVELFKAGKITEARKLICGQVFPEEMDEIYRWLYDNIELFGNEEQQDSAVLIIKQGLVDHALVADPEINLAATLIRLGRL